MSHQRKPLHLVQFLAGLAMLPLAVWFYWKADYLGVAFTLLIGALVLAYTSVNLFVRKWP